MPYAKNISPIAKEWVEKTLSLEAGQELFIPCANKGAQNSLKTRLYAARKEYSAIDPVSAEGISFALVFRDGNPFIKCYKSKEAANIGFIKDTDGTIREVVLNMGDKKVRVLELIKEGKTLEEVEEELGELSVMERNLFKIKIV